VWERAKWACDLWAAAFFAPLNNEKIASIPTTGHVWDAASGRPPQGRVAGLTIELALAQPFFHWPLEFPEIFAVGSAAGFDVMLGNPPWERIKLQEKEFFATRDRAIAEAANKPARERLIDALYASDVSPEKRALGAEWVQAKHASECGAKFARESGRYPLTAIGDINTYAIFAETFLRATRSNGRAGFIVPTGIATDDTTKAFFDGLMRTERLISLFAFENEEFVFPNIHHSTRFCLLTLGGAEHGTSEPTFVFFARNTAHLSDDRRKFTLSSRDIALINPNTHTCPTFRSKSDAELARTIYRRVPILIDQHAETKNNPWNIRVHTRIWHMTEDAKWFRTAKRLQADGATKSGIGWEEPEEARWVPLYEAKMIHQFDHRWSTYELAGDEETRELSLSEKQNPSYLVLPRYWVPEAEVERRLSEQHWSHGWLFGWRETTSAHVIRTLISAVTPRSAVGHKFPLLFSDRNASMLCALIANLDSLVTDFCARQKVGATSLGLFTLQQLPVIPPDSYGEQEIAFIRDRVLELTFTANDVRSFAEDLGYDGDPFKWDPDRRALLRAELDAYYAYLYGLTRRELEYILDPKTVMGEDYPSETFRVLKENEINEFGEFRTERLVLEAWDRFVADGTFDPARLREPQYIDRVAQELTATRARLEQVEQDSKALLNLARATPKPTLFVEGVTDAKIIEAAWTVFFPKEPMPVKVIAAGGTKEMGSLAGKGKALRDVLGQQVVLVLADNDSAGRQLTEDGHVRKGGSWRQLPNGIHWCLLRPTAAFAAAMKTHNVPTDYWPFTIEAAFSPALRRQAEAAGAWRFSGAPQAELLDNPDLARRLFTVVPKLGPDDDAYWYLMAPHPEAKEAFAAWVTDAKQRTEANYAAFEEIVRGLRTVLAFRRGNSEATGRVRGAA
jgi:hypothetical protein